MKDQLDSSVSPAQQRARGTLIVEADVTTSDRMRCATLRQEGSFRALFPRGQSDGIETVILNTAGGITGGDRFFVNGVAHDNALLTMTTQAAERIYRAKDAHAGILNTTLHIGKNARLNWLPQETILFDGCVLSRRLTVSLTASSTFLMVEPVVFGRLTSNETMTSGHFTDRVTITRDGLPIYIDSTEMSDNMAEHLSHKAIGGRAAAMANVVFYNQNAARFLDHIRTLLPKSAGATMLSEELLVIRMLAPDSYLLRKTLVPVLTHLNNNTLPKNWRL